MLWPCVWLQHPTLLRGFIIKSTNYIQVRWYTLLNVEVPLDQHAKLCTDSMSYLTLCDKHAKWLMSKESLYRTTSIFLEVGYGGKTYSQVFKIAKFEYAYTRSNSNSFPKSKNTVWIFPLYFQLPYLPEETCFQQLGSSAVERTSQASTQAVLGSSNQLKVPTSLSLFLKSEKIPALLSVGKGPEYRPLPVVLGIDLKSRKGLYSGPSPIHRIFICWIL